MCAVHDNQRSGRRTDEFVAKTENGDHNDRKLTLDAMVSQIFRSFLHKTITKTIGYRKLCAW